MHRDGVCQRWRPVPENWHLPKIKNISRRANDMADFYLNRSRSLTAACNGHLPQGFKKCECFSIPQQPFG